LDSGSKGILDKNKGVYALLSREFNQGKGKFS